MEKIGVEKVLEKIGLTKGESKVYLALLELGTSTKTSIVRKSVVSPSIVYEILEKLIKKGLVSSITVENVKYFQANEPTMLLELVRKEKEEINEKERVIKSLIPLLRFKKDTGKKILFASVYEGLEGLKAMLHEVVEEEFKKNKTKEWLAMGVTSYKKESFNKFWAYWHGKVRPRYKVRAKFIFSEKGTEYFYTLKKTPLSQVRYILSSTPVCVTVTGKKVLVMKYADPSYFVSITNQDVAYTFKEFFKNIWRMAKRA
jgi:predicted transcriptional regulator